SYVIILLLFTIITGFVLAPFITNLYLLTGVLFIFFLVVLIMLLQIFEKYIHPVNLASDTVEKLIKGNYRTRMHYPLQGSVGKLSQQINTLARNLSEMSIHEQMQAEQLSTVVDNMESGLILIDEKGYIHLVNK